jgi:hypothetical protein
MEHMLVIVLRVRVAVFLPIGDTTCLFFQRPNLVETEFKPCKKSKKSFEFGVRLSC